MARSREDLVERLPEPHGTIAHGDLGRHLDAASLDVDQQLAPTLRALTHANLEAYELLLPFRRGPENDQYALGLGLHPGLQIDAVGPDIDIPPRREITALPAIIFLLPVSRQTGDDAGRQVRRICSEQRGQSFLEIAGGNSTQIEHRQQGIEALRTPRPFRKDVGGEADLLLGGHVGGPVADFRALHIQRTDPGLNAALRPVPVPDNALTPIRKSLFGMLSNESIRFGPKRGGQHPAGPVPGDRGQWIRDRSKLVQRDNIGIICHGVSCLWEAPAGFSTRHDTPPPQTPTPSLMQISLDASFLLRATDVMRRK